MTSGQQPPPVDAYSIFLRARAAVGAAKYPSALAYTIIEAGYDGNTPRTSHYKVYDSLNDDKIFVDPISEETADQPPRPHGINERVTFQLSWGKGGQTETVSRAVGPPDNSTDLLGVPMLSPTYMFGMQYDRLASPLPTPRTSNLPVIAVVATGEQDYSVSLLGTAIVSGVGTYELNLTPLREPKVNRLRQLWVGIEDYLPRKAVVVGNFTVAPLVDIPWTVDFAVVDGAPFIADEIANQPLFMPHHQIVRNASIKFENVRDADDISLQDRPLLQAPVTSSTLVEPKK